MPGNVLEIKYKHEIQIYTGKILLKLRIIICMNILCSLYVKKKMVRGPHQAAISDIVTF